MDRIRPHRKLSRDTEARLLARIVDAMLAVQDDLEDADDAEWSRILVDACQNEKHADRSRRIPVMVPA